MADEEPQQSGENKSTSKIDDDEPQLVAGRKPAVKVGGMRVRQHKNSTSSTEDKHLEDVTGLTTEPNITPNPKTISGAPDIGNAAFSTQSVRVAQQNERPAKHQHQSAQPAKHNINQPFKQ